MKVSEPKIWLVADTHFNHAKMVEYGRPADFEVRLWDNLKVVQDGDILIHLGDFCIGNDRENHERFMREVKGKKVLVRGNHDKKSDSWLYKAGWDFVCKEFKSRYFGIKCTFTHIPIPRNETAYNFHGHTHGDAHRDEEFCNYYDKSFHKEVAMELTGYRPILLTQKLLINNNEAHS